MEPDLVKTILVMKPDLKPTEIPHLAQIGMQELKVIALPDLKPTGLPDLKTIGLLHLEKKGCQIWLRLPDVDLVT